MDRTEEAQSKVTLEHEEIKRWAKEREGIPMRIKDPDDIFGGLQIGFEDDEEDSSDAEAISWDDFFKLFEESNLAFQYQEKTLAGKTSRFYQFVDRDTVQMEEDEEEEDEDDEEESSD